jgi:hypothetical protein
MSECCVFCLDRGSEPLLENASCSCRFQTHQSCWDQYIAYKIPPTCPTCRKTITPALRKPKSAYGQQKPVQKQSIPAQNHTNPEQIEIQIIVPYQTNTDTNHFIETSDTSVRIPTCQKIVKLVLTLFVLGCIILIIKLLGII